METLIPKTIPGHIVLQMICWDGKEFPLPEWKSLSFFSALDHIGAHLYSGLMRGEIKKVRVENDDGAIREYRIMP